MEVGASGSYTAGTESEAVGKLAATFSASWEEVRESVVTTESFITDDNKYSELYVYVDYNGKNNGEARIERNDMNLECSTRWVEDSEMVVDISFMPEIASAPPSQA